MKIILNRHPGWRHNVPHCHHNLQSSHNTALSERTLCNIQFRKLTFATITIGKIIQNDHKYHHGHGNHDNLTIYLGSLSILANDDDDANDDGGIFPSAEYMMPIWRFETTLHIVNILGKSVIYVKKIIIFNEKLL